MKVAIVKKGEVKDGNAQSITQELNGLLNEKLGFKVLLESNASEIEEERSLFGDEFKLRLRLAEDRLENYQFKKIKEMGFAFDYDTDTKAIISALELLGIRCFVEPLPVEMIQDGKVIFVDLSCDVKERIEDMIEEKIGIRLDLQEDDTDDEFQIYLHTDNYEDLEEEEIDRLEELGLDDCPVGCTEKIKELLNIEFKYAEKGWKKIK
ncbi:hypothetical protein [Bacillus toyonensis]|uniref:hypothetical protein n=1 Tax=Bacillus toyonensis TaxID=155322 RepID=UPI002E1DCB6E|nr:hypothetical protein [Bacillus toyonensis]